MMEPVAAGIDIGGTTSAFGLVDRGGQVLARGSVATPRGDPMATVSAVCDGLDGLIGRIAERRRLRGAGVGAPNGNYYRGTVEQAPNLDWPRVVQLDELFRARLEAPVWVTNDANAAALGERLYGATRGLDDFLLVTLGTGLGSGFVVNGRVLYGHDGFAGELGHVIVAPGGRRCGCGRRGCLETYASVTGIVATVRELLERGNAPSDLRAGTISGERITAAAEVGDPVALRAFDATAQALADGLADAVAITSPEVIVLFGGLARSGELLLKPTRRYLEQALYPVFRGKIRLLASELEGADAAILGAAALAWSELDG